MITLLERVIPRAKTSGHLRAEKFLSFLAYARSVCSEKRLIFKNKKVIQQNDYLGLSVLGWWR